MGYVISYIVLALILLAFIPAIIAAKKNYSFSGWYPFGLLLFPVALVKAIGLKAPVRIVNIYSINKEGQRRKKSYKKIKDTGKGRSLSVKYLLAVLSTKLIFSIFVSFTALAIIRLCVLPTISLYIVCIAFAAVFAVLLSVVEIFGLSKITLLADEITKRALMIFAMSVIASVPMLLAGSVLAGYIGEHYQVVRFCCTLASFVGFIFLLFRSQRYYYAIFRSFFDYCVLSVFAYVLFAAATLAMLSMSSLSFIPYMIALPVQLFNFSYFDGVEYIGNMSAVYGAAVVHFVLAALIFFSGLGCKNYKRKELLERVEYRTKAFRISRKRILRRHIPKMNTTVKPLK